MKLRIIKNGYDHFIIQRRYLGFLWFEYGMEFAYYYHYLYSAEARVKELCKRHHRQNINLEVVKEINCKDC